MLFDLESSQDDYLAPKYDAKNSIWKVCGFNDVFFTLNNPDAVVVDGAKNLLRLQNRSNQNFQSLIQIFNGTLIFQNYKDHEKGRNFLKKGLLYNSTLISSVEIKEQVRKILKLTPLNKEIDAVSLICNRIPVGVMGRLLGLEVETSAELALLNRKIVELWEPLQPISKYVQGNLIAHKAIELISRDLSIRRSNCVLNSWFSMGVKEYGLTNTEISALLFFLFVGGIEETSAFLGNSLLILLTEPQIINAKNLTDGNVQSCIFEMLRFCGPIRAVTHRVFANPIILSGTEIPANSPIECNIENAHFDPTIFENPEVFNVSRKAPKPIIFGGGIHGCLGRRLAIIEAAALLQELSLNYKIFRSNVYPQWDKTRQPLRKQKEMYLTLTSN